jgi:hypothetical protein
MRPDQAKLVLQAPTLKVRAISRMMSRESESRNPSLRGVVATTASAEARRAKAEAIPASA